MAQQVGLDNFRICGLIVTPGVCGEGQVVVLENVNEFGPSMLVSALTGIVCGLLLMFLTWLRDRQYDSTRFVGLLLPGVVNSKYGLTAGGGHADWYLDCDQLFANPKSLAKVSGWFAEHVKNLHHEGKVDGLVFIERDSGPVGMLGSKDLITRLSRLPSLIYRERRELSATRFKGWRPPKESRIAIVSDVATSGRSARLVIDDLQAMYHCKCVALVVVMVREESTIAEFMKAGIDLVAFATKDSIDQHRVLQAGMRR